jgi:uncharacterized protein YidB (DUF937 family)
MSRGFPSMTALLGLLAVAGYQNRDKLAEMLGGTGSGGTGRVGSGTSGVGQSPMSGQGSALSGGLGGLLGGVGGGGLGGLLGGGLSELMDSFKQNGHGEAAESWVRKGPNQPIEPQQLERAISPDVLADLMQQTGLSREELLSRLSRTLPEAVDQYTPEGRLPTATDFSRL